MTARRSRAALLGAGLALLLVLGACASGSTAQPKSPNPTALATSVVEAPVPPTEPQPLPPAAPPGSAAPTSRLTALRQGGPPDCGRRLQSLVDEAPSGATIDVPPCVYRETVTIAKPISLVAEAGAEIRGSDVWTDWTRRDSLWVRGGLPSLSGDGACLPDRDCQPPHQVYLDGAPLQRVGGRPSTGQFTVRGDEVRLADNPTNRTVEVSTRTRWLSARADDVRIEGFTMRHAANAAQNGALNTDGYSRWTIVRNTLTSAHGPIVSLHGGAGHALLDNEISHSGQLGVHGTEAADVLVQGNRIHDNNQAGFDPVWEGGGLKMTVMTRLTVRGNEVRQNDGWGIWCDIDCRDTTIAENRVHHNTHVGISYEISRRGSIVGNVVWESGLGISGFGRGAGIICQNCTATTIADNLVAWCPDGITVVEQERETIAHVEQVAVRANTVIGADGSMALGWLTDRSPEYLFRPGSRNLGADNRYWFQAREGASERFAWDGPRRRLAAFNTTPGEEGGRYLLDGEKDDILAAAGVPDAPQPRP